MRNVIAGLEDPLGKDKLMDDIKNAGKGVAIIGLGENEISAKAVLRAIVEKQISVKVIDDANNIILVDDETPIGAATRNLIRTVKQYGVQDLDEIYLMLRVDGDYLKNLNMTNENCKRDGCYGRGFTGFSVAEGHHILCDCVFSSNHKYKAKNAEAKKYGLQPGEKLSDSGIVLLK